MLSIVCLLVASSVFHSKGHGLTKYGDVLRVSQLQYTSNKNKNGTVFIRVLSSTTMKKLKLNADLVTQGLLE